MSQYTTLFILLDLLGIFSLLIGIFASSFILYIKHKLPRHHRITNLLLTNTCVCTLELCSSNLIIYGYIIVGDFKSPIPFTSLYDQLYLCPIRSYFLFTGFSLLYTSYCLQAYYRLRQVIFYKKRSHYRTFVCLILIQWIFSFLLVLPMLLSQSFVYVPTDHFCPIPFSKPFSVAYIAISVYGVFLTIFGGIYLWIYMYAHRTTSITIRRRRTIDRQVTILKRMIYSTFSLSFLGIVYLTLFFQAIANQYRTHYLTYCLSYLFIAIGIGLIHIITILQTPTIRKTASDICFFLQGHVCPSTEGHSGSVSEDQNRCTQLQQLSDEQIELVNRK